MPAQTQTRANGGDVERLHARLDSILDPDAAVQQVLHNPDAFFEGPLWIDTQASGYLIFSDIAGDAILKCSDEDEISILYRNFFEQSPASRTRVIQIDTSRFELRGPNGLALDSQQRIVYCGYGPRHVGRIGADQQVEVLAESYQGRRLNTPNDVVIRSNGDILFTDSTADRSPEPADPFQGVPVSAVYLLRAGELRMLHSDFELANGLAFSTDEEQLYVNDTRRKVIWRFDVDAAGGLTNRHLFIDMTPDTAPGVPDGMKVDAQGNVYCTGPGGLWIMARDGTHLGTIRTQERLTNVNFGGQDRKTLYMTGPTHVWRIPLRAAAR